MQKIKRVLGCDLYNYICANMHTYVCVFSNNCLLVFLDISVNNKKNKMWSVEYKKVTCDFIVI